jgi:hypothetical protein
MSYARSRTALGSAARTGGTVSKWVGAVLMLSGAEHWVSKLEPETFQHHSEQHVWLNVDDSTSAWLPAASANEPVRPQAHLSEQPPDCMRRIACIQTPELVQQATASQTTTLPCTGALRMGTSRLRVIATEVTVATPVRRFMLQSICAPTSKSNQ